jgi:hypothetical protein
VKGDNGINYGLVLSDYICISGKGFCINQDISDVTANNWGVALAKVIKNVDFKALCWGGSNGDNRRREA